jgi:hypothetical protein
MDSAQLYQKLLTDAIRKQILILGPQITLLKIHNVPNLAVTDDGTVASLGSKPEETVTRFLEEFRDLSAPLVKKTMQPLLSALGPAAAPETNQPNPTQSQPANQQKPQINQDSQLQQQNQQIKS